MRGREIGYESLEVVDIAEHVGCVLQLVLVSKSDISSETVCPRVDYERGPICKRSASMN